MTYIDLKYRDIKDKNIDELTKEILKHDIGFPYKKYFMESPCTYFTNIFKLELQLEKSQEPFNFDRNIILKTKQRLFYYYLSPDIAHMQKNLHDNRNYVYIKDNYDIYKKVNILTDYYTEEPRVKSTGYNEKKCPYQYWIDNKKNIIRKVFNKKLDINAFNLREEIYFSVGEARPGKISSYYTLFHYFNVKKVLDPAMAWGDRLIAAIAHNVEYYCGIDPNTDLIEGHNAILNDFKADKQKFNLIYEPFEDAKLDPDKLFDFILLSPCPFVGDYYGNREGQSTERYHGFVEWFWKYMFVSIYVPYTLMTDGGYFCLTILDRTFSNYAITELLLLVMQYKCPQLFYHGVIAWETKKKDYVPFWIWKRENKKDSSQKIKIAKNLLEKYYSHIIT